jgi:tetratricopeptide (TPR) repeat protein
MRLFRSRAARFNDLAAEVQRAWEFHRAGQYAAAEPIYRQVLRAAPGEPDTLLLLGILLHQTGRALEALPLLEQARDIVPKSAAVHYHLGVAMQSAGRPAEAVLASFDRALALQPNDAATMIQRGVVLGVVNRPAEALASFDNAISLQPHDADAHSNRAAALLALKRYDEGLASAERALAIRPNHVGALANQGRLLLALGRPADALRSVDQALALHPGHAPARANRYRALLVLNRYDEILREIEPVLQQGHADTSTMLLGVSALCGASRFDDALALADRLLAITPLSPAALVDKAVVLEEMGRHQEALGYYERALDHDPDHVIAHINIAICRLRLGDLQAGWAEHEWRWRRLGPIGSRYDRAATLWVGQTPIVGKTILLHAEQGFGDTIQFCRYATIVASRGARVVLEVQSPLQRLLTSLAGPEAVIARGEQPPPHDLHCPLMSLPLACGTTQKNIPAAPSYLHAASDEVTVWRQFLGEATTPRIGLVWAGNPAKPKDHRRSIPLTRLRPLLDVGCSFYSLQTEVREEDAAQLASWPSIIQCGNALVDFAETAALITALDLIISVDTSVAHLAGALGKPVWVLLPYLPDWRWGLHADASPWYPSARLFRQPRPSDWDAVILAVRDAINLAHDAGAAPGDASAEDRRGARHK